MSPALDQDPIRVGVNLMWCIPGRVGGSEQYLVRQLLGLHECGADVRLRIYGSAALDAAHDELSQFATYVVAPIDGRRRWRRVLSEMRWLRRQTRRDQLVHHGGGTAPRGALQPYVLTIHDLQYLTFPQHFSPLKLRYLSAMVPRSCQDASVITVPTEYVRSTVIDRFGIAPRRVMVVPHGYEPALLRTRGVEEEVRQRYGLDGRHFVVFPAITHPHKNHRLLVDLLAGPWSDPDLRVVLLGGQGAGEQALVDAIAAAGERVASRIVRPGRVSDADRNTLVIAADALVFPSTYEGFGAPLIEAMALGTPVLCSDAACLPEVAGDAAVVRPPTVDAWADALDLVRSRHDELVAAGDERVAEFTSRRSGEALDAAYRRALG